MVQHWFYVTNPENWPRIVRHQVIGVPDSNKSKIALIRTGDQMIVYLKREMCIAGIIEATSECYVDEKPIFVGKGGFPWRIKVMPKYIPKQTLPFSRELIMQTDFIRNKIKWGTHLMGHNGLRLVPESDFMVIYGALRKWGE